MASGQGFIAEKILEIAAKHQVPFTSIASLWRPCLNCLPVLRFPELYELVAQVLAFVLRLDEKQGRDYRGQRDG